MPPTFIQLFGVVGQDITLEAVQAQLSMLPTNTPLVVLINSDGGLVAEATAIYNLLRTWPGGVEVVVIGWALSSAAMLVQSGRVRRMHSTSMMMVHAPHTPQGGNATQLRETADALDAVSAAMRAAFQRTGQPAAVIDEWFNGQDHWFTAEEALAVGLVDEVIDAGAQAAAPMNVYACRHRIPPNVLQRISMPQQHPTPAPSPAPGVVAQLNADQLRAEGMRIEALRRSDIAAHFDGIVASYPSLANDLRAEQRRCEADTNVTAQVAGQRILAMLARGAQPLAGGAYVDLGDRTIVGTGSPLAEFRAAAEDALLIRAGFKVKDAHPGAKDLRRTGFNDIAARMLELGGVSTRGMSGPQIVNSFMTTSDLSNLLSNLAGKSMRIGYENAPTTFTGWTGERELPDFKRATLVSLSEAPNLQKVSEGGEYTNGSLSDSASNFQVETYGRILSLTRQALTNDDLGAFTNLPNAWGQSARRLEADLVYAALTSTANLGDGVPLFHASRGNLAAAGDQITIDALGLARAAMRKQKDIAGLQYIDPQPRFLIVPVSKETQAEQLLASINDPDRAGSNAPTLEWMKRLTLVADPRLDAVSEISWYLAASPQQIETIIRVYLMGEERPHIEEQMAFRTDAYEVKARLDVGAGTIDPRGLYKNPGA